MKIYLIPSYNNQHAGYLPSMSDNEYRYWMLNENRYKKEVQILAKNINRELKKLQYKSWNQALEKLAEVDINFIAP